MEFVYSDEWTNPRCGVDSVSVENGRAKIIMKQPGFKYATNKGASSATYPIYYENAYELLDRDGEELGMKIHTMHEDIFDAMHKI